jgi:hypothetical protein
MILLNKADKEIIIIELTVCFESGFAAAEERKLDRYASIMTDLKDAQYNAKIFTIEIGSRGMINDNNVKKIDKLLRILDPEIKYVKRHSTKCRQILSKISILSSYVIFYAKYCMAWNDPGFISL